VAISALICQRCGATVPVGASFCQNCGATLEAARPQADRAPWTPADIFKAIGIIIAVLIGTSIPFSIIALVIAGDEDIEQDPLALTVVLAASVFLEIGLLWTAVHFSVQKYRLPWSALGLRRPQRGGFWLTVGLAFGLVIGGLIISYAYFGVLSAVGIEPDTEIEETFQSPGPLIVLAVLSLFFAPFAEEIFFRGFVFGGLRGRWGVGWAALASGALFALAHIGNPGTIYLLPPVAAIGALFALGYAYSGSIFTSILAHFLFNLFALAAGIAQYS
jgi:membrane protease YdiL (CAAX protease family)/ribosomal protein L40E